MRPIASVFFSLVLLLLSFSPLDVPPSPRVLAGQGNSESDLKILKAAERDLARQRKGDPDLGPGHRHPFMARGVPFQPCRGSWTNLQERKAIHSIVDDFLVNDDMTGGCDQWNRAIARDPSGNFVISWEDERNGNYDIYVRRYDSSGTALGSGFKVNDDAGTADQYSPDVAMDSSGNFVISWHDYRNGDYDIYAQRYNPSGTPLGSNFKVNGATATAYQYSPTVAMDGSGKFIIAWQDYRNGSYPNDPDIYAQRYNSSGAALGSNFKVNDDAGTANQYSPDVAVDGSGNFVIGWEDKRNGNYDIYAQRYNSSGTALDSNFKVNDDAGTAAQEVPVVALDGSGNFIIAWQDYRSGNYDIYAQRYNSSGTALGSNFKVNDDVGTANQLSPAVAMDGSGNFVITWYDYSNGQSGIYAQRYSSSGTALGSNFKVNDDAGTFHPIWPDVAMDGSGNFVIIWLDFRNGDLDIYAQGYDSSGTPLGSNFKVNDDVGTASQYCPAVAMDGSGNFVISWYDYRSGDFDTYDIYAQRYHSSGTASGSNFKVNDDAGTAGWYSPAVAMDGSGNFIISWQNYRNGNFDICAQRYNSSGTALGSNFKVNDDAGTASQYSPAVDTDGSGNFVISWRDYRNGDYDIYAQRYNPSGTPLGSNFKVNGDTATAYQYSPDVAMDGSGNFVISWYDYRNGDYYPNNPDIYAQRYDSLGTALGSNFRVNDDTGTASQYSPDVATDGSGNFVISWDDYRNGDYDIYAQRYNSSGTALDSNFKVNDDAGAFHQFDPAIAMDGSGNFVIGWQDYRNGSYPNNPDIYAQRYGPSGERDSMNYLVPNPGFAPYEQMEPAIAANSSTICFTWQDNRRAKGWDIYAKVVDWTWTDVQDEEEVNLPHSFELSQNYPNPFNPVTRIQYTVGSRLTPLHTTLKIYNILGQKVRILVDEPKRVGSYGVIWDGKDDNGKGVASGIYFYQLKTKDITATKKMILLR